jgi:hypothetical protein
MRSLQRNRRTIYYRLFSSVDPITTTDEWGNVLDTAELNTTYSDPVPFEANVSPATGASITEQFGNLDNYDKVKEDSVLYIDTKPIQTNGEWSKHDYVVRRIAKSLNGISIAVRRVDVS